MSDYLHVVVALYHWLGVSGTSWIGRLVIHILDALTKDKPFRKVIIPCSFL